MPATQTLLTVAEAEAEKIADPNTKAIILELVSEVRSLYRDLAKRDQEAADNVAEQFTKQRVDHYRRRAIKAEERVRELEEAL